MPVNMLDKGGNRVVIPDDQIADALANGLHLETPHEQTQRVYSDVLDQQYGGIGGKTSALGAGLARGLTFGLSDVAAGALDPDSAIGLSRLEEANPITSDIGQIAGSVIPAFFAPESILARTPAGAVSRIATGIIDQGRAMGGISGAARVIGASGIEGAAQNAGAYLSDVALGQRDLSAEGLASSLGTGFVFGGAGGAAVLGAEKGTIAARRMFSRLVDGSDAGASVAAQAWQTQYQATLDAHNAALDIAKAELAKARAARESLGLARDQASADLARIEALAPEIDAAHAAATGLDQKIAVIEAMDKPAPAVSTGGLEDLDRLVFNHEASKSKLEDIVSKIESTHPAGAADDTLEQLLLGTKQRIDAGESLPSIGKSAFVERQPVAGDINARLSKSDAKFSIDDRGKHQFLELTSPKGRGYLDVVDRGDHFKVVESEIPEALTGKGLGQAMYEEMANHLRKPLRSDYSRTPAAESMWERLEKRGLAKRIYSDSKQTTGVPDQWELAKKPSAFVERPTATRNPSERQARALEIAKDDATERAINATNDIERATANSDLRIINSHISSMGRMPNAVDDVHAIADAITKYEKSGAELVEGMGDIAPPLAQEHADAFRAAEDAADRKMIDRATRAIDDHVDPRQALRTSKADYKQARVAETQAKMRVREIESRAPKAPVIPSTGAGAAKPSTLGAVLMTAELANDIGIPGIPRPHDIPIIGPLLSAYLKYRVMKAAIGRFTGRVAATGDTHAATVVAKTKEKIAHAIDRTLGLVASTAPKTRAPVVAASVVLGRRLFDDGEPDAPNGASSQDQAAVRIREILNANSRPDLIQAQVRHEMRNVVDPDLIAAAEKHLIARFAHLADVVPKPPDDNDYAQRKWKPSTDATHELKQRLAVIRDPEHALSGPMSPAAADTFRTLYPQLYELAKQRLMARVSELSAPMSYANRLRASMLFQMPVDTSMDPQHIAIVRATDESPPPELSQPGPPPAPTPSPDLSSMYNPANTRVK